MSRMQNATNVPLLCSMKLQRHITLTSNTTHGAFHSIRTLWSASEGPVPPGTPSEQPCQGTIRVPATSAALPSVSGDLVRCRYTLECAAAPARGCCAAPARVEVPVAVAAPAVTQEEWEHVPPQAPPDWQPEVMPRNVRAAAPAVSCDLVAVAPHARLTDVTWCGSGSGTKSSVHPSNMVVPVAGMARPASALRLSCKRCAGVQATQSV